MTEETSSVMPMKVLCVDDNKSNLSLIEQILAARPNVEMLSATNGESGLALAREQAPDLVLLDLNLPDIPGEEILARLKSDPSTRETAVVVVSADFSLHQREHVRDLGAVSGLVKPVDVEELLHIVDHPYELQHSAA